MPHAPHTYLPLADGCQMYESHTPTASAPFASSDDRRRLMRELESEAELLKRDGMTHEHAMMLACSRWVDLGLSWTRERREIQVRSVADDLLEEARNKDAQRGRIE